MKTAHMIQPEVRWNVDAVLGQRQADVAVQDFTPSAYEFGIAPKIPSEIRGELFADRGASQPSALFVLLDGARLANLPERLESSGLEHRCLYKDKAESDHGEIGPWLVKLEEDNQLTTDLFADPGSDWPWHLGGDIPGVFFRSSRGFDALWRHLRKFTRLCDETGRWHLLRFWEPRSTWNYMLDHGPLTKGLLQGVEAMIVTRLGKLRMVAGTENRGDFSVGAIPASVREDLMLLWSAGDLSRRYLESLPRLVRALDVTEDAMFDFAMRVIHWCRAYHVRSVQDVMWMGIVNAYLGLGFDTAKHTIPVLQQDSLASHFIRHGRTAEDFAVWLRSAHPGQIDLVGTRKRAVEWIDAGGADQLVKNTEGVRALGRLAHHFNTHIYGAHYAANPLCANVLFSVEPDSCKADFLTNVRQDLIRQISALDPKT